MPSALRPLDRAERAEIIGALSAHVGDTEGLAAELAEPDAEHDAARVAAVIEQRLGSRPCISMQVTELARSAGWRC